MCLKGFFLLCVSVSIEQLFTLKIPLHVNMTLDITSDPKMKENLSSDFALLLILRTRLSENALLNYI